MHSTNEKHCEQPKVLVLGIGNMLWADEGFGVRAIEALNNSYSFSDNVSLMDGGTQGLYLVPHIQEADILVIFDAIDYGLAAGTLKVIKDDDVPKFMGVKKMSLHQTGFQEVLSMAELLGDYPEKLLLVGVQPKELEDYGGSLTDEVKAQIKPTIDIAVQFLIDNGIECVPVSPEDSVQSQLADQSLTIEQYESQRPSAESACRIGDDRILNSDNIKYEPTQADFDVPSSTQKSEPA